jgi:hypothetical protein
MVTYYRSPSNFAPEPLYPLVGDGVNVFGWTFRWRNVSYNPAAVQYGYLLRRKHLNQYGLDNQLLPDEYWDGLNWVATIPVDEEGVIKWVLDELEQDNASTAVGWWNMDGLYSWAVTTDIASGYFSAPEDLVWSADQVFRPSGFIGLSIINPPPDGELATSEATIQWNNYGDGTNWSQKAYRLSLKEGQWSQASDDTWRQDALFAQDWTYSPVRSITVPEYLQPNTPYTANVQVLADNGRASQWYTWTFVTNFEQPPSPTLAAVVNNDLGTVTLTSRLNFNLLSEASADFETDSVGEWTPGDDCASVTVVEEVPAAGSVPATHGLLVTAATSF